MIDTSFIEKIEDMSKPDIHEFHGMVFSNQQMHKISPATAKNLVVNSLTAVEDYCQNQLEKDSVYIIHVKSPGQVDILTPLDTDYRQRETLLTAMCGYDEFSFDCAHGVEQFVIKMQAQFVQDDTTAVILALVGNITAEAQQTTTDDGVTQRITAKAGIVRVEDREVPNPVILRPYRTFIEVEQPASKFVLRVNASGPTCALYEADGGAWKNVAIQNISAMLNKSLAGLIKSKQITILA